MAKKKSTQPRRDSSRWTLYGLERVEGLIRAKSIVVFREANGSRLRIWFHKFFDEFEWNRVETVSWDEGRIRIDFPVEGEQQFYGLPPNLFLDVPGRIALAGVWTLRRPDGAIAATFRLRDERELSNSAREELEDFYISRDE